METINGAFWAIQIMSEHESSLRFDREIALQNMAVELKRREAEVGSYFLVRLENKIRRIIKGKR